MKELPTPTFALSSLAHPAALPRGSLHQGRQGAILEQPAANGGQGIQVAWARHQDEVRQAQRLRYQVFAGEMGARARNHRREQNGVRTAH